MTGRLAPGRRLPQWTVSADEEGSRLDRFLAAAARLGSRATAKAALERGQVFVNDAEADAQQASVPLRSGDVVRVWRDRPGSARRRTGAFRSGDLQILFEDDRLVVVNKPAGLLTVPLARRETAPSVYAQLREHLRGHTRRQPLVVHRIDRDTSGLVLFAKTPQAQRDLKLQFSRREPERVYLALVYGHPEPSSGTWRDVLAWDDEALVQTEARPSNPRATEAVSHYRVVERFADTALVEVRLHTGKRNQIRIQAGLRGHALVGERRYTYGPPPSRRVEFPRQALHAYRLAFTHPADGRALAFEAPLPSDFADLLQRLRAGAGWTRPV